MVMSRRTFLAGSGLAVMGVSEISGRAALASVPEAPSQTSPLMQPPLVPTSGPEYRPVVTLNGWTLPELLWRFTKVGTFEFACLIPGHYETGMKGVVVVK